jgi:hypothetical protein
LELLFLIPGYLILRELILRNLILRDRDGADLFQDRPEKTHAPGFTPQNARIYKKELNRFAQGDPQPGTLVVIHHLEGHQILGGAKKPLPLGEDKQIFGAAIGERHKISGDHGGMYSWKHHLPGMRNIHGDLKLRKGVVVEQLSRRHDELGYGIRPPGNPRASQKE